MSVAKTPLHRRSGLLVLLALLAAPAVGQSPPGQSVPARLGQLDPELRQALRSRIELGQAAHDGGRYTEARDHFLSALAFGPATPGLLRGLLTVSARAGDADAAMLWAIRYYAAAAGDRGRCQPDKELLALLPKGESSPASLAKARAAAVDELARFASKRPRGRAGLGNGVLVRWASDVAWQLMRGAPALQTRYGDVFRKACDAQVADYQTVLRTLRKVMAGSIRPKPAGQGDTVSEQALDDVVIRAARCLTGMGAQAKFKDRKGPVPPASGREDASAKQIRGKIRKRIEKRVGTPLTLEQLVAMTAEQRVRFTADRAAWANPGIAVSPSGKYLIQTTCGFETLLGVVETIELHHARLATWFGKDPFGGRQGLVRIVPASDGLEAEGSPYWWAGGFQSGDRTTVKFNWGRHRDLGRTLTHELTHRFDGTVFAFLPAWLVEGKAVWTGAAYRVAEDGRFAECHVQTGQASQAFLKGYGDERKLRKLIEGTIDDYRDNYFAGNALYTFLANWKKNGKALFAGRLQLYMRNARAGRKKPVNWFVHCFADNKNGRPDDLGGFVAPFREFLHGCYQAGWNNAPAWMKDYATKWGGPRPKSRGKRQRVTVMDEPTFVWARDPAEPWFGQHHAAQAGVLLAELGQDRPAAAALLWSLSTDDWQPESARLLAGILDKLRRADVAWAVRAELRRRGLPVAGDSGPAPMATRLPNVRAYLAALRGAAKVFHQEAWVVAAREVLSSHNQLGAWLGRVPVSLPGRPKKGGEMYPRRPRPTHLGLFGWTETGLTDYEERRVEGLWYQTGGGDLHVGRKRPREDSGLLDRRAHQNQAFVRSVEWFGPDDYVFKTRVHFTTSFVAGAIILGYSRRDRQVRLRFEAGDFLYSIGRKDSSAKTNSVSLRIVGKWRREEYLRNGSRGRFPFKRPKSHFDVEVRVTGPRAIVYVEGERFLSYVTADLSPIMGSIGVAMRQGAVRLQNPTVQRQRVGASPHAQRLASIKGRTLPGVPLDRHGTLVIWLPGEVTDDDSFDYEQWLDVALDSLRPMLRDRLHYPQKWALLVPKKLSESTKVALARQVAKYGFAVAEHGIGKPLTNSVYGLYVGARGGVRVSVDLLRDGASARAGMARWARVSRARR